MSVSSSEYRDLSGIEAVLLDLEGTLYSSGRLIPGASDALSILRESGQILRFLTNVESKSPRTIVEELGGIGIEIAEDELFTPFSALSAVIGSSEGSRVYGMVAQGLRSNVPCIVDQPPYTHVLVGDCREILSYERLDEAYRALNNGAAFLALQRGRYLKRDDGRHVDTGAVVAGLEYACGVSARVLGKPAYDFFSLAASDAGVDLSHCLVVGDDASTDIKGGSDAGAMTVQVRTGKFRDQLDEGVNGGSNFVIDSIADLPRLLSDGAI